MANRVLVGKRGSDFGAFVSRSGVDVTDTSSTTPLSFDSQAASSLLVHSFGQGALVPLEPANASYTIDGTTFTSDTVNITHGLGYRPAFAVRWCTPRELTGSGTNADPYLATKVWTPFAQTSTTVVDIDDENEEEYSGHMGLTAFASGSGNFEIEISNQMGADEPVNSLATTNPVSHTNGDDAFGAICLYSYVIFTEPNFLNGESL